MTVVPSEGGKGRYAARYVTVGAAYVTGIYVVTGTAETGMYAV
ncbi:MAG: hypothetical protein Kow0040_09200 [Thermogutta sp.]